MIPPSFIMVTTSDFLNGQQHLPFGFRKYSFIGNQHAGMAPTEPNMGGAGDLRERLTSRSGPLADRIEPASTVAPLF